jgi:ABC-type Mn2+/Zn2+ transport system permease subunit
VSLDLVLMALAGVAIAATAAFLGSLMLGRRMALVAGPLGHLTIPGVALALLYGVDVSLGAFPVVVVGVALIWLLERRTKLPMEALTALVFATGVALTFLFLPMEQAEVALVGDITKMGKRDAVVSIAVCAAVAWAISRLYRSLVLINISEDLASSVGIDVRRDNLLYLLLVAVVVALGVKMVGGLLTAALVAIPAITARNVGRSLREYVGLAVLAGASAALLGILAFALTGVAAGPLIVLVSAALFGVSLLLAR